MAVLARRDREELRNLVISNIGGRTDKNSLINSALNLALEDIAERLSTQELETEDTTVIAEDDYRIALPDGFLQVTSARLIDSTSSYPMEIKPADWVTDRFPNPSADSTGRPYYGYVQGGYFYFVPYSDDDYSITLSVKLVPNALSDDADYPTVKYIDRCIVAWATYYVYQSMQQYQDAKYWFDTYLFNLDRVIKSKRSSVDIVPSSRHKRSYRRLSPYIFDGRLD